MTYAEKLALYEKLVATKPDVPRKGDTMPYTSLNGNMFTLLTKEGTLVLRLDPETQAAFIKAFMWVESGGRQFAVSSTGCAGLMQFCPGTARTPFGGLRVDSPGRPGGGRHQYQDRFGRGGRPQS